MPVPQYIPFRQKLAPASLRDVTGGMNPSEVLFEIERGARFVQYEYVISVIIMTFLRRSKVLFLKPHESAIAKGMPYALTSMLLGWWGIPWGLVRTPEVIYKTLRGGTDITPAVLAKVKEFLKTQGTILD